MPDGGAPRARPLALLLLSVLVLGILAAVGGRAMPRALGVEAPPEEFSAARARRVLDEIARAPHPAGSEEHGRVLAVLVNELRALGLEPELQEDERPVPLTNVLAHVPGADPTGTVLCLAHYDSVPTGPGAGDDGVGVTAWLEAFRALRARGWRPRNDVLLLLTDGEELGLLGAQLFAREHPAMRDVRTVVNLEAIGNGGPAVLFELGPDNGPRVAAYGRSVEHPAGTSLADAVYGRMPNDTDLSVFLRAGIGGFNLALTSGSQAYHAPHDTPANLDPRSLQHMGESALALAEHLGAIDLATLAGPSRTFFDLGGRVLVRYPRALDPLVAGLGVLLASLFAWRARPPARVVLGALVLHGVRCVALAAVVALAWRLLDAAVAAAAPASTWTTGNTTSAALAFLAVAFATVVPEARAARADESRSAARALAAFTVWSTLSVLALALLPGAGFAFAWPLVLGATGALAWRARGGAPGVAAAALVVTLALALLLGPPILHLLLQLFMRDPPHALFLVTLVLASAAALFAPAARVIGGALPRAAPVLAAVALGCLAAGVVVARVLGWRQGALLP